MTNRRLSTDTDDIITELGSIDNFQYGTVATLLKREEISAGSTQYHIFTLRTSANQGRTNLWFNDGNELLWGDGEGSNSSTGPSVTTILNHLLIIAEKPTGNSVVRWHIYDFTAGTWAHSDSGSSVPDSNPPGVGGVRSTTWDDGDEGFVGLLTCQAAWENTVKWGSDAAVEAAGLETGLQAFLDAEPDWFVAFRQESITDTIWDLTGNGGDESSIVGTSVETSDDPPGFNFDVAVVPFDRYNRFRASSLALVNNASVTTWADDEGNDDLTSPSSDAPTYKATDFNNLPCVEFDGSHYMNVVYGAALPQPNTTVFIMEWLDVENTLGYLLDGADGARHTIVIETPDFDGWRIYSGGSTETFSPGPDANVKMLVVVHWDNPSFTHLYVNDTAIDSLPTGSDDLGGITLGARFSLDPERGNFRIAEVIVYNRSLSTQDRSDLWAYAQAEYFSTEATVAVGQVTETDVANAVKAPIVIGKAIEGDSAASVSVSTPTVVAIGLATGASTANSIGKLATKTIGVGAEASTASAIDKLLAYDLGVANESDLATTIQGSAQKLIGQASESDLAVAIEGSLQKILGGASESDTSVPVLKTSDLEILGASESDTAKLVSPTLAYIIGAAGEQNLAALLGSLSEKEIGKAIESSVARQVMVSFADRINSANELDVALGWDHFKETLIGSAGESDSALAFKLGSLLAVYSGLGGRVSAAGSKGVLRVSGGDGRTGVAK